MRALTILWVVLAALSVAANATARAAVTVEGEVSAIRLEAQEARLADVLDALGEKFGLRYPRLPALDRTVTGYFDGSLAGLLSRLFEGYDYVAKSGSGEIEIVWISVSAKKPATRAIVLHSNASRPARRAAPPWRRAMLAIAAKHAPDYSATKYLAGSFREACRRRSGACPPAFR